MPLTHTDVRRILEILDSAEHLESLDVTVGEFELHARKPGASSALPAQAPQSRAARPALAADAPAVDGAAAAPPAALTEVPAGLVAVRAPMVGTFYLRPSPDQPPFVTVGAAVQAGDTVCLVEVMKMFNTVKSDFAGTIERVLIENGKPVQHDQIVMLIKPAQEA
ncbi:acetyl-CoA carboxylase biotin carboxyl carrier protein [Variovorax saccharolyticus]|uniref:acetyl-CoA carboxylase biotin carboxyl carrier protein n=1 Tax=Variovorax saccharolyticus TaxID=3053516 RepID=UPI002576AEC6|nr:acetyl-CoA carboxylase biotin carboxyl carrier protein [Variovorax sp. J22R187]MDM0019138.1 acetyl-CoA carboxylase biotin carboxyl carrier protein [Variovorax sp. J22R187]